MSQRYTFRTTRKTEWLDSIIDTIPSKDRSDFIREHLILGLKSAGVVVDCNGHQTSDKPQTKVLPMSNKRPTIVAPEIEIIEDDEDLDGKLTSVFG